MLHADSTLVAWIESSLAYVIKLVSFVHNQHYVEFPLNSLWRVLWLIIKNWSCFLISTSDIKLKSLLKVNQAYEAYCR